MRVRARKRRCLHKWLNEDTDTIHKKKAVAFVDVNTLAVSNYTQKTLGLYTLSGTLIKQLATNIFTIGLAVCADGCVLSSDFKKSRIRVFAPDGTELKTSPLATHIFQEHPGLIALSGERAYVFESVDPSNLPDLKKNKLNLFCCHITFHRGLK